MAKKKHWRVMLTNETNPYTIMNSRTKEEKLKEKKLLESKLNERKDKKNVKK